MPHGGFKQSGYGKDKSIYAVEEYTNIKHVGDLAGDLVDRPGLVTAEELDRHRSEHPGWEVVDGKLHREFRFPNFVAAFGFMASWRWWPSAWTTTRSGRNVYGTVTVDLTTHDLGGIGTPDLALAAAMDGLAPHLPGTG